MVHVLKAGPGGEPVTFPPVCVVVDDECGCDHILVGTRTGQPADVVVVDDDDVVLRVEILGLVSRCFPDLPVAERIEWADADAATLTAVADRFPVGTAVRRSGNKWEVEPG